MTHYRLAAVLVVVLLPCGLLAQGAGPDVIVGDLTGPSSWGSSGSTSAFSIGTTSCNVGSVSLPWFQNTPVHPVIGQNLYRLLNGRFQSVGVSWLKHGFFALQQSLCSGCSPWPNGTALGVGCSDPYTSSLNGQQGGLGPRYEVNPTTGVFPMPYGSGMPPAANNIDRRLQVLNSDLNPAQNVGARYFGEAQYIHPTDASSGNGLNNASWREVGVAPGPISGYNLGPWIGPTVRQVPAVYAWQAIDPAVQIQTIDVPNDGRFTVAYKSTPLPGGGNHYEFAIHNLNSWRSAGTVTITTPCGAAVSNVGWSGVPHHSGEPYATTPWSSTITSTGITWMTASAGANGNAIRWGTLYNYWFDSDLPPLGLTIGLHRVGTPATVSTGLPGAGGAVEYQTNSFSATLDVNGVQTTGSAPAVITGPPGSTHNVNFFSFNGGQNWDLAYGTAPLIPRSACAVATPFAQVLNIDIADPTFGTWFGGTLVGGPPFVNFALPVTFPVATNISMQMVIVSPNLPDGVALSQGVQINIQ